MSRYTRADTVSMVETILTNFLKINKHIKGLSFAITIQKPPQNNIIFDKNFIIFVIPAMVKFPEKKYITIKV